MLFLARATAGFLMIHRCYYKNAIQIIIILFVDETFPGFCDAFLLYLLLLIIVLYFVFCNIRNIDLHFYL